MLRISVTTNACIAATFEAYCLREESAEEMIQTAKDTKSGVKNWY